MALSARDTRHLLLVTLIIAALPILFYPNDLGFRLAASGFVLLIGELAYYAAVAALWNRDKVRVSVAYCAIGYLVGRLFLSLVLFVYLLILERINLGSAWSDAFGAYRPAYILFVLTAPFLYNSTIVMLLGVRPRRTLTRTPARIQPITTFPKPAGPPLPARLTTGGATTTGSADYYERTFAHAVQHIGEYSGVVCAMLIDAEGLPVAGWSRDTYNPDAWAALSRKMVDEANDVCARGGSSAIEALEFRAGRQRFYLYAVLDMWLLSIADSTSDELEKIRVHQAADMIVRRCQERYTNVYMTEAGRPYVGSAV